MTHRNAGFLGGKFLERTRVLKPGFSLQDPQYYNAADLYVGASVQINHFKFKLVDADEYVFNHMEEHANEFPQANVGLILRKLKGLSPESLAQCFKTADPESRGWLARSNFIGALLAAANGAITKHVSPDLLR